jgi:predicted PurR-regulated permease PerM
VPSTRAILKVLLVTAATAAVLYLLYLIRSILGLVFISIFLAVALGPAVDVYEHRARLPRGIAIGPWA